MACLKNAARTILIALFADIVIAIAKLIGGRSQFRFWPPAQFMRMASFPFPTTSRELGGYRWGLPGRGRR
jgi:hypothetical protein